MACPDCGSESHDGVDVCPAGAARERKSASGLNDPLRSRVAQAVEPQYVIVRLLGRGGMGAVYLARDQDLNRLVALKVLPPDLGDPADRRARFRREAQLAAQLSHPNIVPLHSFGESDGLLYYVMGYVRGESLADRLRREERIPQEETRLKLAELADALECAHGKGVIHRDIKPDNILLDDETGRALLADFGIARAAEHDGTLTEAGGVIGTVHYMSPEQAVGASAIDGRSDLYSLGVVGYVMLTGGTPFDALSFPAFIAQQATVEPPALASRAPEIAPDLTATIMRCLARDAASRWPDARAFKQALGAALDDDSERLPGELREVAGVLFWSAAGGWLCAAAASLAFPAVMGAWAPLICSLLVASVYAATALVHHRKGFTWTEMGRVSLWPPPWWPFWWPAAWRRPEDLWRRLPRTVRVVRGLYGTLAIAVFLALPLAVRSSTRPVFLGLVAVAWLVLTVTMVFVAWWAHRSGIPNNADLRSLFLRSSTDRRFWKRPQMARQLLAPPIARAKASPQTPAEYVRAIVETTQRVTGPTRDAGLRAAEVARQAFRALDRLDREIATMGNADGDLGPDQLRQATARRSDLATGLHLLCTEYTRLSGEPTEAVMRRVADAARSLAQHLGLDGSSTGGDAATISVVTAGVTTGNESLLETRSVSNKA